MRERESAKHLLSRLLLRGFVRFPTLDIGDQLAVEKVLNPKTLSPKPSLLFPLSFLLSLLSLLCLLLSASLAVDGIWEAYRRGRERERRHT